MRTAITVAVTRQLAVTTLLLVVGCSGCTPTFSAIAPLVPAPILLHSTMPRALATTTCSLNNQPIILVDSTTWYAPELREEVIRHEETHAARARAYRGGCWPYMYRVNKDKAFRIQEQLVAFCEAARFAQTRNRNPERLWQYIKDVMVQDTVLSEKDNCLYEPWEGK
jgi:hypothetical protein